MTNFIQDEIQKLATVLLQIQNDLNLLNTIQKIADCCLVALKNKRKILFAGNGGSAADSQHLAAELVCRLRYDRPGLPAIALTTDTSALTAIANDYSFKEVFARQLASIGQAGDVFIGISTSGKSENILRALDAAKKLGIATVGFSGATAPLMSAHCDYLLNVPSKETPKIQECHIMFGHIICSILENTLFGAEFDPLRKLTQNSIATNM